jgi:hypothetical protein
MKYFVIASLVGISLVGAFGLWLASIQPQAETQTPVKIVRYRGQSIEFSGLESQVDGQKPVKFSILAHNFTGCTGVGVLVFREMHYHPPVLQKDFAPGCNDKTEQKIQEYEFPIVINSTDFREPGSYIVRASFFAGRNVYGDIEKKITVTKDTELDAKPTIVGFDEFYMRDDSGIFTENMTPVGILEAGREYYVIQKVDFRQQRNLPKDGIQVNGTVGYALQYGDKMVRPPMGDNVTDAEQQEYMRNVQKKSAEFREMSTLTNSYDFVVDAKNPFYTKFPLQFDKAGQYTFQFYQTTDINDELRGKSNMGGLVVVQKYGKAVDNNGICRTKDFILVIKHDYSTVACTSVGTFHELRNRGWALS